MSYIMVDIEADWPSPGDYSIHTHHPVDDAKGNAEAFLEMIKRFHLSA